MADAYQQYQARRDQFMQQQMKNQLDLQALDQARLDGIKKARAREASTKEFAKMQTRTTWAGLQVLAVVSFVILLFLYNSVFAKDKRIFWVITVVLVAMLIYKFVQVVKEDGGLAIGYMNS